MAGLLGQGWEDPKSQAIMALSGGLLQGNFGAGLLGANNAVVEAKNNAAKQKYVDMQMQNMQSEIEARKLKTIQDQRQQELIGSVFGGLSSPGSAPSAMGGPGGAPQSGGGVPTTATPAQLRGVLAQMTPDHLARLKMAGIDLTEIYKLANVPTSLPAGSYTQLPGQAPQYLPDPVKGVTMNGGVVSPMAGAPETQARLTLANEMPKAVLGSAGRVNLRPNADGTQSPVSELTENPVLGGMIPGIGNRPPAMPTQGAPGRPMVSPDAQRGADAESIRMLQSELQNPSLPPDHRAALQRELSRMTVAQSTPGFPTPTMVKPQGYGMTNEQQAAAAAAKVAAEATARAGVERQTAATKKSDSATDMLGNIKRARTLLEMGPTGSLAGAGIDSMLGMAGMTTASGNAANALETLSGWLTNSAPRMEGPQSNIDQENYKTMAGRVGDRTVPVAARLAALNEVERIQKKYAHLNQEAANVVNDLPKTAAKGSRARDTVTGKVLTFNGLSWVAEK